MLQHARTQREVGLRLPHHSAVLAHQQRRELLGAAGQDVGGGQHLLRPLLRRGAAPDLERGVGLPYCTVHVGAGADRDLGDDVVETTGIGNVAYLFGRHHLTSDHVPDPRSAGHVHTRVLFDVVSMIILVLPEVVFLLVAREVRLDRGRAPDRRPGAMRGRYGVRRRTASSSSPPARRQQICPADTGHAGEPCHSRAHTAPGECPGPQLRDQVARGSRPVVARIGQIVRARGGRAGRRDRRQCRRDRPGR